MYRLQNLFHLKKMSNIKRKSNESKDMSSNSIFSLCCHFSEDFNLEISNENSCNNVKNCIEDIRIQHNQPLIDKSNKSYCGIGI